MSHAVDELMVGPPTFEQASFDQFCTHADWFRDLNPELQLGLVTTPAELLKRLKAAKETLELDRGKPGTPPKDDAERSARRAVLVRAPHLDDLMKSVKETFELEEEPS